MKLALIAAVGKNYELGWQGDMPWKNALKKDLAFFREKTSHHALLMGRRTFESLPSMLPGRPHLVVTSHPLPAKERLEVYPDLDSFFKEWQKRDETVFVIGGGTIYSQLIDAADEIYLTEIDADFQADTWFPHFDPKRYTLKVLDEVCENGYTYRHVLYSRI